MMARVALFLFALVAVAHAASSSSSESTSPASTSTSTSPASTSTSTASTAASSTAAATCSTTTLAACIGTLGTPSLTTASTFCTYFRAYQQCFATTANPCCTQFTTYGTYTALSAAYTTLNCGTLPTCSAGSTTYTDVAVSQTLTFTNTISLSTTALQESFKCAFVQAFGKTISAANNWCPGVTTTGCTSGSAATTISSSATTTTYGSVETASSSTASSMSTTGPTYGSSAEYGTGTVPTVCTGVTPNYVQVNGAAGITGVTVTSSRRSAHNFGMTVKQAMQILEGAISGAPGISTAQMDQALQTIRDASGIELPAPGTTTPGPKTVSSAGHVAPVLGLTVAALVAALFH